MDVRHIDIDEWEKALPARGFEVFHTPAALRVLDEHSDGEMRLFGAFKGNQAVGLFPVFLSRNGLGRAVTSPPPSMGIPHLGPILMPNSPKRRKREKINREFARTVLDEMGVDTRRTLFRMICQPGYSDPRPYQWSDLDLKPQFTYVLDAGATSTDELLSSFSSSLRREIRDAKELDVSIETEGIEAARTVHETTKDRYEEQGEHFPLTWPYVRALLTALDDRYRVYVVRAPDGSFLTGITVLYSNDRAYFWQGGTRAVYEDTGVNGALHWRIITDIAEDSSFEGVTKYDMMGANTPRLCRYKSKFGADLVPYYVVESAGTTMDVAKQAYKVLSR